MDVLGTATGAALYASIYILFLEHLVSVQCLLLYLAQVFNKHLPNERVNGLD